MISALSWWLILELLGLAALPIAFWIFRWLPGRGYVFARPLGLLLSSYILWLGASAGFLRNDLGGILFAILAVAALSGWVYLRAADGAHQTLRDSLRAFLASEKRLVITTELLFAAALVAWAILRAYAPDKIMPAGGEKFMESAFQNGILNSPQFPPLDPWLSGFAISYYYFGYVMMALLTRLSGVPAGVGFDLYDALLFALTATGVFGVVFDLVTARRRETRQPGEDHPDGNGQAIRFGLLGSLLVVVMGNLEGLLEAFRSKGILPEAFFRWIDVPDLIHSPVTGSFNPGTVNSWWWWRGSRVLRDLNLTGSPVLIQPITEFPFFSFLLGDNHPHVLALPFVLLAIALAFNLLRRQMAQVRGTASSHASGRSDPQHASWWNPAAVALDGDWALFGAYALILGSLAFLNTWDMPIYLGLVVLAYAAGSYAANPHLDAPFIRRIGVLAVSLFAGGILLYLFFFAGFSSQAAGILPYILYPTRLPQYLVMFGGFLSIVTFFLLAYLRSLGRLRLRTILYWWSVVALVIVVFFMAILALAAFSETGRQLAQGALQDQAITDALGGSSLSQVISAVVRARLTNPWLFLTLSLTIAMALAGLESSYRAPDLGALDPVEGNPAQVDSCVSASDVFVLLLILSGVVLTLSVEFLYLRDSFGARMNTIFKFYYQTWVMLGIASAYACWWVLHAARQTLPSGLRAVFSASSTVLVLAGLVYPVLATYSRVQSFQAQPSLDGTFYLAAGNPDDFAAIRWLRENALPKAAANNADIPVILEAPGKSYNFEGRISAFSGLPAVLGWSLHEGQWRGDYTQQGLREPDIATIYTTPDAALAIDLLHKWQVKYVILGGTERNYIQQICQQSGGCTLSRALRKFETVFSPVFTQGEIKIYLVPGASSSAPDQSQ